MTLTSSVHSRLALTATALILVASTLTGCAELESRTTQVSNAVDSAKEEINSLKSQGEQLLGEAKKFTAASQDAVTAATTKANEAAAAAFTALDTLSDKKADAQASADDARAQLETAKAELEKLSSTLSGDELAAIEAERDKIMSDIEALVKDLEAAAK